MSGPVALSFSLANSLISADELSVTHKLFTSTLVKLGLI